MAIKVGGVSVIDDTKNLINVVNATLSGTITVGSTPSAGTAGQVLTSSGASTAPSWSTINALPTQTGNNGKLLTTDGATASWAAQSGLSVGTATNLAGGVAGAVHFQSASGTSAFTAAGTAGQVLTSQGSGTPTWTTVSSGGTTLSNDTSTNSSFYPVFTTSTSGTMSTASVSNTKLYFNPSTGVLNATLFNSLSDSKFKTNVVEVVNGLELIKQISAVEFDWIDGNGHSSGVIAQQLEGVIGHLVTTNEQGEKSVNYSGLIAYLISAVKELSDKIGG